MSVVLLGTDVFQKIIKAEKYYFLVETQNYECTFIYSTLKFEETKLSSELPIKTSYLVIFILWQIHIK